MDTHSNKTSYKLTVLEPDTTYHIKVLTQCLSKLHKTNEVVAVRTPEGGERFLFLRTELVESEGGKDAACDVLCVCVCGSARPSQELAAVVR